MDDEEGVGTYDSYKYKGKYYDEDEEYGTSLGMDDEEADFEDCVENCREERGLSRRSCKRRCNSRGSWQSQSAQTGASDGYKEQRVFNVVCIRAVQNAE